MFKHILVPTDGSPLSRDAVARAIAFAKEAGARITLFYAEPDVPTAYAGMGALSSAQLTQEVHARLDGAARDILAAAEQVARDAGVACDCLALVGNQPYALIIQAAESRGCDLIFMASHGRRGLSALLLGSETQKVLTHSTIPVLVYR
jgi:nucleotide-binding universal stress UspA family protein